MCVSVGDSGSEEKNKIHELYARTLFNERVYDFFLAP